MREDGVGLDYGLPGGTRLGVVVTTRGGKAGGAGLASGLGMTANLRQPLGPLQLDTSFAYSRNAHEAMDGDGRAPLDSRTASLSEQVALPLDLGGGVTLTPWAGLAYVSQAADGLTLHDPSLGEQRFGGVQTVQALASFGLDGQLAPVRLTERTWLTVHAGLSFTEGLGANDDRVRVAALGVEREEKVALPTARAVGVSLGSRLVVGDALTLDASMAVEEDLAEGPIGTGRVALTWYF